METISSLLLPMDPAILLCVSSIADVPYKNHGCIFSTDTNASEFHSLHLGVEIVLCPGITSFLLVLTSQYGTEETSQYSMAWSHNRLPLR